MTTSTTNGGWRWSWFNQFSRTQKGRPGSLPVIGLHPSSYSYFENPIRVLTAPRSLESLSLGGLTSPASTVRVLSLGTSEVASAVLVDEEPPLRLLSRTSITFPSTPTGLHRHIPLPIATDDGHNPPAESPNVPSSPPTSDHLPNDHSGHEVSSHVARSQVRDGSSDEPEIRTVQEQGPSPAIDLQPEHSSPVPSLNEVPPSAELQPSLPSTIVESEVLPNFAAGPPTPDTKSDSLIPGASVVGQSGSLSPPESSPTPDQKYFTDTLTNDSHVGPADDTPHLQINAYTTFNRTYPTTRPSGPRPMPASTSKRSHPVVIAPVSETPTATRQTRPGGNRHGGLNRISLPITLNNRPSGARVMPIAKRLSLAAILESPSPTRQRELDGIGIDDPNLVPPVVTSSNGASTATEVTESSTVLGQTLEYDTPTASVEPWTSNTTPRSPSLASAV